MAAYRRFRFAGVMAVVSAILAALVAPLLAEEASRRHVSVVAPSALFSLLVAAGERFALDSGNEMPVVEPLGSEKGLALFCAGEGAQHPDIIASLRRLTPSDLGACTAKGIDVSALLIGHQAVALVQLPGPARLSLTRRQLFLALAREVAVNGRLVANPYRLWSDIDFALPVRPIAVLGPPPGSRLHDAFVDLVMAPEAAGMAALRDRDAGTLREDGAFTAPGGEEADILAALRRRPDAIGVVSFSHLLREGADLSPVALEGGALEGGALEGDALEGVALDGVAPDPAALVDGRYPAARPVHLYVKRRHAALVPGLGRYLATLLEAPAAGAEDFRMAHDLVPLPPGEGESQRAALRGLAPL